MGEPVLWLHELSASDAAAVGGKAANLGLLAGLGLPVPPGFVVPVGACRQAFEALGLADEIRRLRGLPAEELEARAEALRARLVAAPTEPALAAAILDAHARLLDGRAGVLCAVRSSATAEDLGGASFAGQHGTYYYVEAPDLLAMVRRCWASLFSVQALSYRATHGLDEGAVAMAVVVQEMIASEVSGVAFTVNPVTGARGELVVESSWGMGAALVDGRVTPDRFVLARDGLHLRERRIAEKRLMVRSHLVRDEARANPETRLEEVPAADRLRATLAEEQVRAVAELALLAERHFGAPQDVEWAVAGGRTYVLQSRPVTVQGAEDVAAGVTGRWVVFKPLVENFTDPLTPLTQDVMERLRPPGLRFVRGWIYLDVDLVCRVLPFRASAPQVAEMLYALGSRPPSWPLAWRRLPAALLLGLLAHLGLAVFLRRNRHLPDGVLDGFRALCRQVEDDPAIGLEGALDRLALQPGPFAPIAHMPLLVNLASMQFAAWMPVLRSLLRRWAPDLREDAEVLLGSGSEGVLSAEVGRGLWALAQRARGEPAVSALILATRPEKALGALLLEPRARGFLDDLFRFLGTNGHRALKEFDLRSVRWEEDPAPVFGMIRNYLSVEDGPDVQESRSAAARTELRADLAHRLETLPLERVLGLRRRLIERAAERVRYFLKLRENSRFYHTMIFGVLRRKALAVEGALLRQGRLRCQDDVFFLRAGELDGLLAGRLGWREVEDRIRERRMEHIRLGKMGPPRSIGVELPSAVPPAPGAVVLQGQAASTGRYVGVARVILDPAVDAELAPGEVLVAPYTDPAWTPLFLSAGAAVVEVGSYLSHAGTVAREFGLPCVVDVAEATRRIRSGDRVEVDGVRGVVRLLDAAGAETAA